MKKLPVNLAVPILLSDLLWLCNLCITALFFTIFRYLFLLRCSLSFSVDMVERGLRTLQGLWKGKLHMKVDIYMFLICLRRDIWAWCGFGFSICAWKVWNTCIYKDVLIRVEKKQFSVQLLQWHLEKMFLDFFLMFWRILQHLILLRRSLSIYIWCTIVFV